MTEIKNSRDISVVFTKEKVWTSAAVSGIVVAKAEKNLYHKGESHEMKSVISKLYNGEIFPAETAVPTDSGYRSSVNKVGQEIEELQEVLTGEQYSNF